MDRSRTRRRNCSYTQTSVSTFWNKPSSSGSSFRLPLSAFRESISASVGSDVIASTLCGSCRTSRARYSCNWKGLSPPAWLRDAAGPGALKDEDEEEDEDVGEKLALDVLLLLSNDPDAKQLSLCSERETISSSF